MTQVSYEFVAAGQDAVLGAFKSIGKGAEQTSDRVGRAADKQGKAQERAANQATAAISRAEAKRYREAERSAAQAARMFERHEQARVRAAQRANDQIQRDRERTIADLGSKLQGAALTAGALALTTVGAAAREVLQTQETANRVSINARKAGGEAVDPTILRREFETAAIATPGQKAQDIGEATQKYVDLTGDLDMARSSMQTFATVASATGASVQDVATAAAAMGKQFDIKKVEDMQQIMAVLTEQGKGGALTMKDMAAQMQKLAAAGKAFGIGEGIGGLTKIGGLMQIAREGTKSPQSAGTAVEALFRGLSTKQKELAQIGVHTYDKQGRRRDINAILPEVIANAAKRGSTAETAALGQDKLLNKLFGTIGGRGVSTLIGAYRNASEEAGGGAAGQKAGFEAVAAAMLKAESAATSWSEVQKDASQAQQDASAQLLAAWERLKANVGEKIAPKLLEMVPALTQIADASPPLVSAFAELATAVAGFVAQLQAWGILKETTTGNRVTDHKGNAAAAQKDLDELDAAGSKVTSVPTAEQVEKREALQQTIKEQNDAARIANVRAETEQGATLMGLSADTAKRWGDDAADAEQKKIDAEAAKAAKAVADAHDAAAKAAQRAADSINALGDAARSKPLNKR